MEEEGEEEEGGKELVKNEGGGVAGLRYKDVRADIRWNEVLMLTHGWLS